MLLESSVAELHLEDFALRLRVLPFVCITNERKRVTMDEIEFELNR